MSFNESIFIFSLAIWVCFTVWFLAFLTGGKDE